MAVLRMPTRTDLPHYEFEIELEQRTYVFEFRWNDRAEAWFMEIRDTSGERLLSGRRVVINFPLLARFRDPRLPPGELTAIDTSGDGTEPGVNDLGARVALLYYDASDNPLAG